MSVTQLPGLTRFRTRRTGSQQNVRAQGAAFDFASRRVSGASPREWLVIRASMLGARISSRWAYRGFGFCCRNLQRLVRGRSLTFVLNDDTTFTFPLADGYWSMLLGGVDTYEAEIENVFKAIVREKYTLLDCGANYGYWSVLVSGRRFGSQRVIAFEPSSSTYEVLRNNARSNAERFACVRKAMGATDGLVGFSGEKHEARAVCLSAPLDGETVEMLSPKTLLESGVVAAGEKIVLKLDIEGQEIAALDAAAQLLQGDCMAICEDHGADRTHAVSRHILENTSLKLFCYDDKAGHFMRITNAATLDRIKRYRNRGYNVFATSSAYWEEKLLVACNAYLRTRPPEPNRKMRILGKILMSVVTGRIVI